MKSKVRTDGIVSMDIYIVLNQAKMDQVRMAPVRSFLELQEYRVHSYATIHTASIVKFGKSYI